MTQRGDAGQSSSQGDVLAEAETIVPGPRSARDPDAIVSGEDATLASPARAGSLSRRSVLRRGQTLGRFMVIDQIGAGAMGQVVSAYDPDLHRRVAIKVLHGGLDPVAPGAANSEGSERMLREARAMAQLAHPNVITVFEVDRLEDGQVFIAMEFVDGGTLGQWARADPRPDWPEVLRVYGQAARGLAAAHAVGLVHRDFKPDNVLIGNDGRVRVTDFGLVGVDPSVQSNDEGLSSSGSGSAQRAGLDVTLTRTGTIMGTPAYMAPEQGKHVDARSDQFSFCVALYEALYAERPFVGETLAQLRSNVLQGNVGSKPRGTTVPTWIRTVVLRGLSIDPQLRYPNMLALATALQRDPAAGRRSAIAGVSAVAVAGGLVWAMADAQASDDPCRGGVELAAQTWDQPRSNRLREAFEAASPEHAEAAHAAVANAAQAFASAWAEGHRDACEATNVYRSQSDAMLDRRMLCLQRRAQTVDALLTVFESADDEATVSKAEAAAANWPGVAGCTDTDALAAAVPAPDDGPIRQTWQRLHYELDRAEALGVAGQEAASLALYASTQSDIDRLDHPPLSARLRLNYGNALVRQQRWQEALKVLDAGPIIAARAGDATVEAKMWLLLAKATGFGLNDPKTASTMARAAAVAAVRAGDPPELTLTAQYVASMLADAQGDYAAAVVHAQRCVELALASLGREHGSTSALYGNLGNALDHAGRYDAAMEAHRTSMAIDTALHGQSHPNVGHSLVNIGLLLQNNGDYAQAADHFTRALAIYDSTVGREHGAYATALLNLGQNAALQGRYAEARDQFAGLLTLYEKTLPALHADIALAHQNLGSAHRSLDDLAQAEVHYRKALRMRQQLLGDEHPKVMLSMNAVAQVQMARGAYDDAEKQLQRAVDIGERTLPNGHPDLAYPLQSLGIVLSQQQRYDQALPLLERAVQLRAEIDPKLLGRSELALGQVLWFLDRPAGEAMLERAAGNLGDDGRAQVRQFVAQVQ